MSPPSPPTALSAFSAFIASVSPLAIAKSCILDDQPCENNGWFGKKESTDGKFWCQFRPSPVPYWTCAEQAKGCAVAAANASHGHNAVTAVKRECNHKYEHKHKHNFGLEEHSKHLHVSSSSGYVLMQYFTPNPMLFACKKWAWA